MDGFNRPIEIDTPRCRLEQMRRSDTDHWFGFMSDARIIEFLPDRVHSRMEMAGIIDWLISNYRAGPGKAERITLAIRLKETQGPPIGWVTFGPLPEDESRREIGYALAPEAWGKGIATEAAGCFLGWLRSTMPAGRLYATVDERNTRSIRVLRKLGMKECSDQMNGTLKASPHHVLYEVPL